MAWAAEQRPPTATCKLALLVMASMADGESNRCWPSYQHLADQCMVSRRTMATTIKKLSELGFISVQNRANEKGQTSNVYTVNVGDEIEVSANSARGVVSAIDDEVSAIYDTVSANPALGGSEIVAHETVTSFKQSKKQSEKQSIGHATKGKRISPDWQPTAEDLHFILSKRPDLSPEETADNFRDYWLARSGSGATKVDWSATWRNWVRNQRAVQRKKETHDKNQETLRRLMANA